jgi:two-component system response regulator HydG
MNKIILLTDDPYQQNLFAAYLSRKSYHVETMNSIAEWNQYSESEDFIILSQCTWPGIKGPRLVQFLRQKSTAPIIIFTPESGNLQQAISTVKAGAVDYLLLPVRPDELLAAVELAFSKKKEIDVRTISHSDKSADNNDLYRSNNFYIGSNFKFQKALEQVNLVAQTNYSVIIYGESGTGKEMIARLIHEQSERKSKPFVAIDCGSLTEELANSELFGHEKGAYTGAVQFKKGCLEKARGGTVFLDEIANLSYSIQVALLRVLQERKIKRIGSTCDTPIDVRIIVASNEHLTDKIQSGLFREDLYYRLNEFYLELPPLRACREDLGNLINHFIRESNRELNKNITGCSQGAFNILYKHDFPGNIRELKNVIRRACLVAGEIITIADLPINLMNSQNYETSIQEKFPRKVETEQEMEEVLPVNHGHPIP